eukprot:140536-Amorphochlora_amoeboformis.AAC.3
MERILWRSPKNNPINQRQIQSLGDSSYPPGCLAELVLICLLSFSFMKSILPKYFSSEWSFAHYKIPDTRTIVAFGSEPNSIIVVSSNGSFYKAVFDPEKPGSECKMKSHNKFIKTAEEET